LVALPAASIKLDPNISTLGDTNFKVDVQLHKPPFSHVTTSLHFTSVELNSSQMIQ